MRALVVLESMFGLVRRSTRADPVRQNASSAGATTGLHEWLESVELDPERAPGLATCLGAALVDRTAAARPVRTPGRD
jgi:hypothetical protein